MKKLSIGTLLFSLFIPLLLGAASAALSAPGMVMYGLMEKPPFSPPEMVFTIAWIILYVMMGLAAYFATVSDKNLRAWLISLSLYYLQLAMNFFWPLYFFRWDMHLFSFIWLLAMLTVVIFCAVNFYKLSKISTYLFIPYIAWLIFAAYLNLGTYILNKNL